MLNHSKFLSIILCFFFRTKTKPNWRFVAVCCLEILGAIFLVTLICERSFFNDFKEFGLREYPLKEIIMLLLYNPANGFFIILTTFYIVLHSWSNAFAEVLGFSDRLFYKV